ncbi:prephenate dehydratase [Pokkaliibacter sp. CJK22405]|uniref:prephenate dehydratase n=1 Tax=Pokkaliibacter sp. CJK22405 TaxID=3384615 RepID=UPI003984E582
MATEQEQLALLRDQIDDIDQQIHRLINARAKCAMQVAEVKLHHHTPDQGDPVFYRPEREAQVLRKVIDRNEGPLEGAVVARLFREIMSACLALESPVRVAFLGPTGTFTEQAALKHFGHSAVCVAMPTIDDVFREVEAQAVKYGVVPVENSTEGVVHHTLDNFRASGLKISGEVELRIHHNLLVKPGSDLRSITRIYSHQQSLAQCRLWLDSHYPSVELIAVSSNAEAARRVSEEGEGVAAIAGEMAALAYGLDHGYNNIEDHPENTTRFLIIGHESVGVSQRDKTSIIAGSQHQPGALYQILEPFYRAGIDLTRIDSRPAKDGAWGYVFYIDFVGHQDDEPIKQVLKEVGEKSILLKILGSYPQAVI